MSSSSAVLEVDGLSAVWRGTPVLDAVTFSVAEGEVIALLGPNGAGKSTLLRSIAGFARPSAGSVRLDGKVVGRLPPHRRRIGLLFQEPTLFPHRTVLENIAYAPLLQRRTPREVRDEVDRMAALLSLERFLGRYPAELSGGERQRVALARTLAARPRVVLLDEPFASVDAEVKSELRSAFRAALGASRTAAIHVTHDLEEGLFLGDRAGLLLEGRLEALGPPSEVYGHPPSVRAARFLGYNVLEGTAGPLAVRPEDLVAEPYSGEGPPYTLLVQGSTGREHLAVLEGPEGEKVELRAPAPLPIGGPLRLRWTRSTPLPRGTEASDPKEPKRPSPVGGA